MFINFWYPAEQSKNIGSEPVKRRMLGQDFVLWRDSKGQAHCLSNTCTHRGGSLSGGKVKDDCIQCPYHGWRFDGDGNCTAIPSLGPDPKIPARTRIDTYPVVERYGLVFCFLGDLPEEERPPIMGIKEWEQEGWSHTIQHYEFNINFQRSIENGIDPAHNEFVHDTHGFKGDWDDYKTPEVIPERTDWGTGFGFTIKAPPLAEKEMRKVSGRDDDAIIWAATGHEGVSSLWTFIHPTDEVHIHQYMFECPVDDENVKVWLINLRNFLTEPEHDERMVGRNEYVVFQDRDVLLDLNPVETPPTRNNEFFMPADLCIGEYRDRLREWEARGWRIDSDEVNRNQMKVAYAIPSPERRNIKGWVLDPVPLVDGSNAELELDKAAGE
ncbi:MAG: aromatic ring-hydroxylating dioxygenase subunit alpha [Gammaproteobacteria bacterium]|nr:aromatic ring-hydroxylating dioxygenase subunit alpha [Gammaproteobacteria bacterium]MDP6616141.1 aromatic ring-hydroxylating dioxygenase subunit alpha [Gammaproteobacteria bacterium]MDP6694841.1 aromatic ring-hydroxylating dioxygenase subunit alpha [Gammaproteobacteria bacterium]